MSGWRFRLQWKHIDFIHNSMLIHSVKKEHHEGKEVRHMPLFDELRDALLVAFTKGIRPDDYVIRKAGALSSSFNSRCPFGGGYFVVRRSFT